MSTTIQEIGTLTDTIGVNADGLSVASVVQTVEHQEDLMPAVYDADAGQVIESHRVVGAKRYKVKHMFRAMTDRAQEEYFNRAKLYFERDLNGTETTMEDDKTAAAVYLHRQVAQHIDGVDLSNIKDWEASVVSLQSKRSLVEDCLIYCHVMPRIEGPTETLDLEIFDAEEGELCPVEINPTQQTFHYGAIVRFNGKDILTHHELRAMNGNEEFRYGKLASRSSFRPAANGKITSIVKANAIELAAFYDNMVVEHKNFVGRVPLFVKKYVAEYHLNQEMERLRGN